MRILAACDEIGNSVYERRRTRAMVLVMRYTALRISDVATSPRTGSKTDGSFSMRRKTAG
jgi:hypothetical protein